MSEHQTPTGESKLWGVSIRSWNATIIIAIGTGVLAYHAVTTGETSPINALVSAAVGFLFGKAAGAGQPK